MAAIDQRGELNAGRPAKRTDRVHRRATGASGEKTSSTMITVRCSSGSGSWEALTTGSPVRVPTSSRCIETSITPVATPTFSIASMSAAIRRASSTPRDGIPARMSGRQIAIALDDFVRDPAQRPAHRFRIEDADRASFFCYAGLTHFLRDLAGSP